jgi:hypothetical protein
MKISHLATLPRSQRLTYVHTHLSKYVGTYISKYILLKKVAQAELGSEPRIGGFLLILIVTLPMSYSGSPFK